MTGRRNNHCIFSFSRNEKSIRLFAYPIEHGGLKLVLKIRLGEEKREVVEYHYDRGHARYSANWLVACALESFFGFDFTRELRAGKEPGLINL